MFMDVRGCSYGVEIVNEQGGYESLDYYGFYAYANEDDFYATDYYLLNIDWDLF